MNWIVQTFVAKWLKGLFDKLPGNGWKTVLGLLLLVLAEIGKLSPEYAPVINTVINLINSLGPDVITDMGVVALVTGLVHKLAKWVAKKQ